MGFKSLSTREKDLHLSTFSALRHATGPLHIIAFTQFPPASAHRRACVLVPCNFDTCRVS